jgi:uncharacterized protein (TIGR02145 family)
MKTSVITILFCFMHIILVAQVPQTLKYQALARDASGNVLAGKSVNFRISIIQGTITGTFVYSELHSKTTNPFGLVDLEIGKGTSPSGTFSSINWGVDVHFIKIEMDPAGGTSYQNMGTSQLLSVPYALYAKTAETAKDAATKAYVDELFEKLLQLQAEIGAKDIDGNAYKTVKIGSQVWMSENLKTTKYRDGTAIPNITGNTEWANLTAGAYCWMNNDIANKSIHGALYNWYAVSTGKICPTGWHVPSDTEWNTLTAYLISNGYNYDGSTSGNKTGKSLAATSYWDPSVNAGAVGNTDYPEKRNVTGFTFLPSGGRVSGGTFATLGTNGNAWSSTSVVSAPLNAWLWALNHGLSDSGMISRVKEYGFSVRCLRDN